METLCTIIATATCPEDTPHYFASCLPLCEAIETAKSLRASCGNYKFVRVYAETNNGATLTLIYSPTP